jgi:pimeloyl-ACP methyl ester carboxylesterase
VSRSGNPSSWIEAFLQGLNEDIANFWRQPPALRLVRPRVLFLPGWFSRGRTKSAVIRSWGYEVATPKLPDWSFRCAVRQAQQVFDAVQPDVVVGSSRGGAVAMALRTEGTPLVLLAPAWRRFQVRPMVRGQAVIIHSQDDRLVPFADSEELCHRNPGVRLVAAGEGHRLTCHAGRKALREVLNGLVPQKRR